MSSRDLILNAIRSGKPDYKPLPEFSFSSPDNIDLADLYKTSLQKNGGRFSTLDSWLSLEGLIKEIYPEAKNVVSIPASINGRRNISAEDDPHSLRDIDVVIVKGMVAVAENAAVWLSEESIVQRALPFITQHLVIVIERKDIVYSMHDAYARINASDLGYGVFIAGPSKTADIEQSLVIGAHGARSLLVAILDEQ